MTDRRKIKDRRSHGFFHFLAGFFTGAHSASRLCAILCAVGAIIVAVRAPAEWRSISAFVVGGCVGLLIRSKIVPAEPPPA